MRGRTTLPAAALVAVLLAACGSTAPTTAPQQQDTVTASTATTGAATPAPSSSATQKAVTALGINSTGLLAGTATKVTFPAGEPGKVSIVATGPTSSDSVATQLPLVLRNNTAQGISHVDITATMRDAKGQLVATGQSQVTTPAQVPAGGLAYAFVYFESLTKAVPKAARYEFTFETSAIDQGSYNTADLKTVEAKKSGSSIVGTGTNATGAKLTGPYKVEIACLDAGGKLLGTVGGFTNEDSDLAPGAKVSFTVDLYETRCPQFLAGITGYFA